ncbi:MAG: serine/threonine dehydratase [Pseudomonadota bacterium]
MISKDAIRAAARRIAPHIRRTPVMEIAGPALGLGHAVTLKLELFQHTGNFKARGAFNTLLSREIPAAGVVAASGGNHGAAVAYAGAELGIRARIFVPEIAGPSKIGLIERAGADLTVVPGAYANAAEAAAAYQAETGALSVHAYDAPETVAGQGTVALEMDEQAPGLDVVLVAVGGGGLLGGVAAAYSGSGTAVVAVEPETAPTLHAALRDGPDTDVDVSGIAANSLGARRIGRTGYDIARAEGIETVLVSNDAIAEAQKRLWQGVRVLAEPGGAAALAALTSGLYTPADGARVGVIVCGANLDPSPVGA